MAKQESREWTILPTSRSVRRVVPDSDHDYDLLNATVGDALVYGGRSFGINLVWGDPMQSDNIRFARKSGAASSIKYKEPIAINVRRGGWLVHKKRDVGINLGWSDTPRYEWRIDGGDATDKVVLPGLVALHNSVEGDWLLYVPRDFGINLRWSGDREAFSWVSATSIVTDQWKKYWDKLPK